MAARNITLLSVDEFLDHEERSQTKHEYYDGVVLAMAGGSPGHAFLAANLIRDLGSALRGKNCRVAGSDLLFQTGTKKMYVYPDVMVICGRLETMEGRPNIVTNPVFVAEVLSPSTIWDDRGAKSHEYRLSPTIRQYALISQDRPMVEIHTRAENGQWWISEVIGLDADCAFSSLECSVPMAALYEGVLEN
jgi:Uma2 family endonuclease